MKIFITSLLLFFTLSLFAQPQKGDLYVGLSNFRASYVQNSTRFFSSSSQTFFSVFPTFGKFIADNTLVGGGLSFSANVSSPVTIFPSGNLFGANIFGAQYFGKGKLKGLSQVNFNANLTKRGLTNRSITAGLGLGGAYFLNKFTSVQVLYNINLFNAVEGSETEYFSNGIEPNIALSLRAFLLRNREGIENLSALNSIKKGTKVLGLSANLRNSDTAHSYFYSGNFDYFFANNLYGRIRLASSMSKNEQVIFQFSNLNFSIGAGYYLRVTDKFYGKLAVGMSMENQLTKSFRNNIENTIRNSRAIRGDAEFGFAFFLGRHKLEPAFGIRTSTTRLVEFGPDRFSDFSTNLLLDYEWFLAENFAFLANANFRFNDVSHIITSNVNFTLPSEVIAFSQNDAVLNVGFKWYFSTPTE